MYFNYKYFTINNKFNGYYNTFKDEVVYKPANDKNFKELLDFEQILTDNEQNIKNFLRYGFLTEKQTINGLNIKITGEA